MTTGNEEQPKQWTPNIHWKPRKRMLTDDDVFAIAEVVAQNNHCNLGLNAEEVNRFKELIKDDLTPEQKGILKRFLAAFDSAASVVGKTVLTAIVLFVIALFTKGFWFTLLEKMAKH